VNDPTAERVRVAITGATGFIGRWVAARHLRMGDEVRVLTRRGGREWPAPVRTYEADLSAAGPRDLDGFVDGVDVLYHCAGELRDESRMRATHVGGTRSLVTAAGGRVGRWVQLSSVGVYGPKRDGVVTEDTPLTPVGEYERTKAESDAVVIEHATRCGMDYTILRPSVVFGPDMPGRALFWLMAMIRRGLFSFVGPPGAAANFIPVGNVADALLLCGTSSAAAGRVYNVSDHRTWEDVVAVLAGALDARVPRWRLPERPLYALARIARPIPGFPLTPARLDALVTRVVYATDRIEQELGYAHCLRLEDALTELARQWMQQ
jgi:nucleoside-diphosphate-sugar epimerase